MSYREQKLSAARAATRQLADDPAVDSAYLAGSLTAGLGSPTSDVDVFVLAGSAGTGPDNGTAQQQRLANDRLDIEHYTVAWVDQVLDKLETWECRRGRLRHNALTQDELDVIIRMRQSEVIKSSPNLDRIRARLTANDDRLRQMLLTFWALEANGNLSDFKGAEADGDLESAGLIGQSLLVDAAKAVAAAGGDFYIGRKWIHRQLHRTLGDVFPHALFRDLQSGAWSQDPSRTYEFLFLQQTLVAAAQLLGWTGQHIARWPFWETGKGLYRRNPQYNTIHLTEGILINNELQRQAIVKPEIALVWALSNGRDEDEIIGAATELAPSVGSADTDPFTADRAREVLKMLDRRGFVSTGLFR